ncbi:MAG: rRNA maturation RNase YbeY [Clostridia bacterium]|nr:rRNA maturation RNase YbeY [Clostridia bacterium]
MKNIFARNKIYICDECEPSVITKKEEKLIKKAVNTVLKAEKFERAAEVSVTVVDDASIHVMNRESRGVDRATDVLSFPVFDEDFGVGPAVLGDIVISHETAVRQANEYGHSVEREIAFLTVHSMLHLLGYDHETSPEDEKKMFTRQEEILTFMGQKR